MFVALAAAVLLPSALAQQSPAPLASLRFDYNNLPYKADTNTGERGGQYGYNICNSTTAGPTSSCQTALINSLDDFCLWAPPEPNSIVGNVEGEMVAWCTRPDRGARQIPEGALQGVQFTRTPHYVQVVGFIDQTKINIAADDYGGEMDPHGADQRGNPLGGLLFSNSFSNNGSAVNGTEFQQVIQWHNFMGANFFCLKACDPSYELGYRMCEHIYDRIGCNYNAPNAAQNGTFETCLGDDQLPPGIYVENGATMTYTQPPESLGVISSIPYQPSIPASSSCTPFPSAQIYAATSAAPSSAVPTSAPASSGAAPPSSGAASSSGARGSNAASTASAATSAGGAAASSRTGAASTLAASSGLLMVAFGFLMLA